MRRTRSLPALLPAVLLALALGAPIATAAPRPRAWTPPAPAVAAATAVDEEPDVPRFARGGLEKGEYLRLREAYFRARWDAPFDRAYRGRLEAVERLRGHERALGAFAASGYWTSIGPAPLPNGQTTTIATPVSGRVTAIAVHPHDPDIVYVGGAQGGVWRSLDGGASWTPLFDAQATLAIGALALAPSDPGILYVGTGEANLSIDSFFGLGLYRIDDADTAPVVRGPFNPVPTNDVLGTGTFTGRAVGRILVDPADPATVFVAVASGVGGSGADMLGAAPPITALRGVYRSTDATSASPSFTKLTVTATGSIAPDTTGNRLVTDIAYDPGDATGNTLVAWVVGNVTAGDGGIWRTTNARGAAPVFSQVFSTTTNNAGGSFAVSRAGGTTTMVVGTGESATGTGCVTGSGCLRRSTDGGVTWSGKLAGAGGFCGGQCWYDNVVAIHPADADVILVGGAANGTCSRVYARSTDGGATFSAPGELDVGLHADAHAIVFAPSDANVVYRGDDGGVFKSTDGGGTWTSLNDGLSLTQFEGLDTHPVDPLFTIGGTQDNGTPWYRPDGSWIRADYGDGGYAVIDQNAVDADSVTMYHTYYNASFSVLGFARVTHTANAVDGGWDFFGCGGTANGISCSNTVLFYAPLVRGPGNPNTLYYGSDRLYRSTNRGETMTVVSQGPIVSGMPISSVAIAPQDDRVRVVGLKNGQVWATTTGSATLANVTGPIPPKFVGRIAVDPTNADVCYVALGGFGLPEGHHVWKTTNLSAPVPSWTAAGSGIPDVPVNAFVVDPLKPDTLYAGTDVGVYQSTDGGASWSPWTTGMPVVSVFGLSLQPTSRVLRAATHGRGLYDRAVDAPDPTDVLLVGAEIVDGHPRLTWYVSGGVSGRASVYRRPEPGDWERLGETWPEGAGQLVYEDATAVPGRSYEYALGIEEGGTERRAGRVWVDVPLAPAFTLRAVDARGRGPLRFVASVPTAAPARLELLDVTGRRIASLELRGLAAGEHAVTLETPAAPGLYWARLSQAGKLVSTRVAVLR